MTKKQGNSPEGKNINGQPPRSKKNNHSQLKVKNPLGGPSGIKDNSQHRSIDLETQVKELTRINNELQIKVKDYKELFEKSPVGLIMVNQQGIILSINRSGVKLLRNKQNGLIGMCFSSFISSNQKENFESFLYEIFNQPNKKTAEFIFINQSHPPLYVLINGSKTINNHECCLMIIDITNQKLKEFELKQKELLITQISNNISDVLFNIQVEPGNVFRFVFVNKSFLRISKLTKKQVIGKEIHDALSELIIAKILNGKKELIQDAIHNHKSISWEENKELPSGFYCGNIEINPIYDQDGVCTNLIGIARELTALKQAVDKIKNQAQKAKALVRIASQLNSHIDPLTVFKTICREAKRSLKISSVELLLFNERENRFKFAAGLGLSASYIRNHQPVPLNIYNLMIPPYENSTITPDIQGYPGLSNAKLFVDMDFRTMMAASITIDRKLLGTLIVFSRHEIRRFTKDDQAMLEAMANQAAQVINNSRLFEQVITNRKRLSDLSQAIIDAQENERRNLALELHDEFGQIISSIKMSLDLITTVTKESDKAFLERSQDLAQNLMDRVRRMSLELRPSMLDDIGLIPALEWLFRDYQKQTGQEVFFECSGMDGKRFSPEMEITIYRIIQESLTNVIRHAKNKQVHVNLWSDEKNVNLQIMDFGEGFSQQKKENPPYSTGLGGMRERARMLGGEMVVESSPGTGTILTVRLPYTSVSTPKRRKNNGYIDPPSR